MQRGGRSQRYYFAHLTTRLVCGTLEGVWHHAKHICAGRCYSSDVLKAYLTMCQRLGIHFISDEIYALSTWDNPQALDQHGFTSILSLDVAQYIDPNRVHVLWGSSKVRTQGKSFQLNFVTNKRRTSA